jgi:hypothetical protein
VVLELEDVRKQRPLARVVIRRVAKKQHTQHGSRKGDTRDVCLRRRILVRLWVYRLEHCVHGTDDLFVSASAKYTAALPPTCQWRRRIDFTNVVEKAIRKQSSSASNHRPQPLPLSLLCSCDTAPARRVDVDVVERGVGGVRLVFLGHDDVGVVRASARLMCVVSATSGAVVGSQCKVAIKSSRVLRCKVERVRTAKG